MQSFSENSSSSPVSPSAPSLPSSPLSLGKAVTTNDTVTRAKDNLNKSLREVHIEASVKVEHDKKLTFSEIDVENSNVLHHQGHRLSLRTVECGERIVHIQKGRGNELGAKRFDRHDKFGVRRRGATASKATKLFGRSTLTANAGATPKKNLNEELLESAESAPTATKLQAFKEGVSCSCVWVCHKWRLSPCSANPRAFFRVSFHR